MASAIDATKPADGVPASKADLRDNLAIARDEISALQGGAFVDVSGTASSSTFLRGDGQWGVPSLGGANYTRDEDGAVTRSLLNLAVDHGVNVKEFGALGDGTGDTIAEWLTGGSHDRGYANLAAIQVDFPAANALTDTIDLVVLQHCCDLVGESSSLQSSTVYVPGGDYVINRTLQVSKGIGGFQTVRFVGEPWFATSPGKGTKIFATSFVNQPAIAVSGARYVALENFWVEGNNTAPLSLTERTDDESDWVNNSCTTGQYNVYCGIAIDPYSKSSAESGGYPVPSGENNWGRSFSNQVKLTRVAVRGFVAGVAVTPADNNSQGDFIQLDHCEINFCAYGVSSGASQNRDLTIFGGQISGCREALTTVRHGKQNGNLFNCYGVGFFRLHRIFWGKQANTGCSFVLSGGRAEDIQTIGVLSETGGIQLPATIQAMDFGFGRPATSPGHKAAVHLYTTVPVTFQGCAFYLSQWDDTKAGILNVAGARAGQVLFDGCMVDIDSVNDQWTDRIYIGENGNFGAPRVEIKRIALQSFFSDETQWSHGTGKAPVGQNTVELRRSSLPARLELNGHSRSVETNTTPYWVQLGDNAPTSGAGSYSHATAGQLTFTASTPADFVQENTGSNIPGDILYWQDATWGALLPMLKVTSVSGSTVTCEKLFSDDQYDETYSPATVQFCPRQWAPSAALTGTTSGSSTSVTMNQSGTVKAGDWITDGTNVRRVASASGTSVTLTAAVDWSGGVAVYWARLQSIDTTSV